MAKRPMKKLELLALAKDRDALLKTLQKAGVMELKGRKRRAGSRRPRPNGRKTPKKRRRRRSRR